MDLRYLHIVAFYCILMHILHGTPTFCVNGCRMCGNFLFRLNIFVVLCVPALVMPCSFGLRSRVKMQSVLVWTRSIHWPLLIPLILYESHVRGKCRELGYNVVCCWNVCASVCVCVCVLTRGCVPTYSPLRPLRPLWRDKHLEQNKGLSPRPPLIPWVRSVSCTASHTYLCTTVEWSKMLTASVCVFFK